MNNKLIIWLISGHLMLSQTAIAQDSVSSAELLQFHNAKIAGLQSQIESMNSAISLMQSSTLTDEEQFELIAEPSFNAYDAVLESYGFTTLTFYQFSDTYVSEIDAWLLENQAVQTQIATLESEYDGLVVILDQLNADQSVVE